MGKLYEKQEQQRRENVMFREQLEKTGRQYREDLNRAEQERDALKQQVDSIVKILTQLNKREMH